MVNSNVVDVWMHLSTFLSVRLNDCLQPCKACKFDSIMQTPFYDFFNGIIHVPFRHLQLSLFFVCLCDE